MDRHELKFLHLNCNKSISVSSQLAQIVVDQSVDLISINEPYICEGSLAGVPGGYSSIHAVGGRFRSALVVRNRIPSCSIERNLDVCAISLTVSGKKVLFVNCYCAPSEDIDPVLLQLQRLLEDFPQDSVVLVGDFNAKSTLWGQRPTDARGRALLSFASNNNLEIINDPDSRPSYDGAPGRGWIDVLLVRRCANRITNWIISDEETLSDHNIMRWSFTGQPAARSPGASKRWRPRDLDWGAFLLDMQNAEGLVTYESETPDEGAEFLHNLLYDLCDKHKKRRSADRRSAIWWTDQLTAQRSQLRALRRLFQRTLDEPHRGRLELRYKRLRAEYKKAILREKRTKFRRFISEGLVKDKMGQVLNVVRGKWRRELLAPLAVPGGGSASTWEQSQEVLVRYHFRSSNSVTRSLNTRADEIDPFTIGELELACETLPSNKAPGHDGYGLELIRSVLKFHPRWLLDLYNHCLRSSCFPRSWKRAIAVFFPKEGRDQSDPANYRPICLLPSVGKILDKLCAQRLMIFLESSGTLDARQFGFRRNRGADDALKSVMSFIGESKAGGYHTCLIALDIKSAFNSCRTSDIRELLLRYGVPDDILYLISSFLENRSVSTDSGTHEYDLGVPQGSCLGPVLWLVLINDLLTRLAFERNWWIQVFADDIFVLVRCHAVYRLAPRIAPVLDVIHRWTAGRGLEFSYGKCCYTVVPPKGKVKYAPSMVILLGGRRIGYKREIEYLGLTIDRDLSWMPHLTKVQERSVKVLYKLSRLSGATWGVRPEIRKRIYSTVIERIILYGAVAWYKDVVVLNNRLLSIQRQSLLCISKCYSTVSTDALNVLTGVLPLDICAKSERDYVSITRWGEGVEDHGLGSPGVKLWRYVLRREDLWRIQWTLDLTPKSPYSYYTDGSRQDDGRVALLTVTDDQIVDERMYRLSDGATVFAAEVQAIKEAIAAALKRGIGELDIYSDSRSALQALYRLVPEHKVVAEIKDLVRTQGVRVHMHWIKAHVGHHYNELVDGLAKTATSLAEVNVLVKLSRSQVRRHLRDKALALWQSRWDTTDRGRVTYAFFSAVNTRRLQSDFYVNQVLTGHGVFGDHQNRFFGNDPTCICGTSDSTVRHVLYDCPTWRSQRKQFFPRDFQTRTQRDLCLGPYSRKGVTAIVADLLRRVLNP